MKLLIISQYFYPEQFRVSDVCFKLAEMGHDITVLTGLPNYPAGSIFTGYEWQRLKQNSSNQIPGSYQSHLNAFLEEIKGVKVFRCKLFPRKTGKKNLARNYASFIIHASAVAKKMIRSDYDFDKIIVFQYSPVTMAIPGIIVKKRIQKPLVLYCFDLWPESIVSAGLPTHGIIYRLILQLSKWIYNQADSILISSQNFEKYLNNKLGIYDSIHYLPIYAEGLFLLRDSSAETPDVLSPCMNLLFAGNIGEMQSLDTIIKAAGLLTDREDVHFHIVGDGSALEKCVLLAKNMSLKNITFHGRHPLEAMPRYYSMADAFLVTLKKDEFISYTLPGKIQSYMAAGKPILAAIDGEASDVIRAANCGLCCEAEDEKGLAQIILQFIEEKQNRQIYGDSSKAYYQANFSEESFWKAFLAFLE